MIATFDRISRNHHVTPLKLPASADVDTLAEVIYLYARPKVLSSDLNVVVDLEKMEATIFCGFHVGGNAKLTYEVGDTRTCPDCGRPQHYTGAELGWCHDALIDMWDCAGDRVRANKTSERGE